MEIKRIYIIIFSLLITLNVAALDQNDVKNIDAIFVRNCMSLLKAKMYTSCFSRYLDSKMNAFRKQMLGSMVLMVLMLLRRLER